MSDLVVVLGGSGMLGSMVADLLARDADLRVIATVRTPDIVKRFGAQLPQVEWRLLDVANPGRDTIRAAIGGAAWVINAIGITKPYIHDDNAKEVERAIYINAILPYELGYAAAETGARVLQITTDCVYDGVKGRYVEGDPHSPVDVYGKTKSLGEAPLPNVRCLRCSIVGLEPKTYAFLLEWFLRQPKGTAIPGYINHQWNGITTLQFARLCHGIITRGMDLSCLQHIVPMGTISKAELLCCFAREFRREDIAVIPTEAKTAVDRTLNTINGRLNSRLWAAAGYAEPPSIPQMVAELAQFDYRLAEAFSHA